MFTLYSFYYLWNSLPCWHSAWEPLRRSGVLIDQLTIVSDQPLSDTRTTDTGTRLSGKETRSKSD